MDELIGTIILLVLIYFTINWAADNPQQVDALRDSMNALVAKCALTVQEVASGISNSATAGGTQ